MIQVSNSMIVLRGQHHGSTEYRPKFWAPMFKAVWGTNLDPEKGIEIIDTAAFAPEQGKYASYESVSSAERDMITFFIGNDSSKRPRIISLFNACYPNGLKDVIRAHIEEDVKREAGKLSAQQSAKTPHISFVEAGIESTVALNLMQKGYGTVAECANVPAMDLVEAGLAPTQAAQLVDLAQRTRATALEAEKAATLQAVATNAGTAPAPSTGPTKK